MSACTKRSLPETFSATHGSATLALAFLILAWPLAAVAQPTTPSSEASAGVDATPTNVTVRVVSQGAKILGDGVGGARVTIRDLETGEVLARGTQRGETGDTERIMRTPRLPGDSVYATPGAASYEATLDLAEPTRVEIVGEGPLGQPEDMQRASTTTLLIPGQDVGGDGIVLTVHGFLVGLLELEDGAARAGDRLRVRAKVRMMCGCPTSPGGLWDSEAIDVTARLVRGDGTVVARAPLRYAGQSSTYAGTLPRPAAGVEVSKAELQVVASGAGQANFGIDRRALGESDRAR
jgi:hypothetical protein